MSTLVERILEIKNAFAESWDHLGGKIGISANTLKTAMQRKRVGSDVLAAVASQYPELSAWVLLGDEVENTRQYSLSGYVNREINNFECLSIIQSLDPRLVEDICVNPKHISRVRLVQCQTDPCRLGVLLDLDCSPLSKRFSGQSIWLQPGHLNFDSNRGGGHRQLYYFREWMQEALPEELESAQFYTMPAAEMDRVSEFGEIRFVQDSVHTDYSHPKHQELYSRFVEWRTGKEWMRD